MFSTRGKGKEENVPALSSDRWCSSSLSPSLSLLPFLSLSLSHLHAGALVGGREAARVLGVRGVGPAGLPPGVERVLEERRGRRSGRGGGDERERDGQRASHLLGLGLMCS